MSKICEACTQAGVKLFPPKQRKAHGKSTIISGQLDRTDAIGIIGIGEGRRRTSAKVGIGRLSQI